MRIKERFLESVGLGTNNPEIDEFASEFLSDAEPGKRVVDSYGQFARFREFGDHSEDGAVEEISINVYANPVGPGLIIFPPRRYISDGK